MSDEIKDVDKLLTAVTELNDMVRVEVMPLIRTAYENNNLPVNEGLGNVLKELTIKYGFDYAIMLATTANSIYLQDNAVIQKRNLGKVGGTDLDDLNSIIKTF